jgi:hypothetical protein
VKRKIKEKKKKYVSWWCVQCCHEANIHPCQIVLHGLWGVTADMQERNTWQCKNTLPKFRSVVGLSKHASCSGELDTACYWKLLPFSCLLSLIYASLMKSQTPSSWAPQKWTSNWCNTLYMHTGQRHNWWPFGFQAVWQLNWGLALEQQQFQVLIRSSC